LITVIYFWKISKSNVPWALLHMGLDRLPLRRNKKIGFWKLLGTGKGETFTPKDANSQRWGLLVNILESDLASFNNSKLVKRWDNKSSKRYQVVLKNIAVQGKWSGKSPFLPELFETPWNRKVVAITRARIKWHKNPIFWRSVPPVTVSLKEANGLISAIGIGEAPIGLQGTFSIWESPAAIRTFAYQGAAHKAAIAATAREKWYAEELFARFAVIDESGSL
jgi:hypothetical protein